VQESSLQLFQTLQQLLLQTLPYNNPRKLQSPFLEAALRGVSAIGPWQFARTTSPQCVWSHGRRWCLKVNPQKTSFTIKLKQNKKKALTYEKQLKLQESKDTPKHLGSSIFPPLRRTSRWFGSTGQQEMLPTIRNVTSAPGLQSVAALLRVSWLPSPSLWCLSK